jgi:hypothetical protein
MIRPSWLLAPFHVAALATAAKSFRDNPVIGSPALNEAGLHVQRMRLAQAMAAARRQRLAHLISAGDAADFERDGFLVKPSFLTSDLFEALRREVLSQPLPARDMIQADAVTRRIALDKGLLARMPAARALLANPEWLGLIRYVGSSNLAPLTYVQTVFSRIRLTAVDPQTRLHSDTFHSSVKAWLFLTDVAEDEGPFVYVPGSHRLTPRRLAWERRGSTELARSADYQASRGSPRITADELRRLGIGEPRVFAVAANTLVVADTLGFHARGVSARPTIRVEIWAYGRRNPFLPWTGLDPAGLPFIRGRAVPLSWAVTDFGEALGLKRNPWRRAGLVGVDAPPDLSLHGSREARPAVCRQRG